MAEAKCKVPIPFGFKNNVLVMSFIGENGVASQTLKEKEGLTKKELEKIYGDVVESYARAFYVGNLVHADLSEFNILVKGSGDKTEAFIIDCGQAVLRNHPKAREFFERDLMNIARFFEKQGVCSGIEEVRKKVEEWQKPKEKNEKKEK